MFRSGLLRLAAVAVVIAALVAIVVATDDGPRRPPFEKAAIEGEFARLDAAHLRKVELRKPAVRKERARLRREQKPHFGEAEPGLRSRIAQSALVGSLERSITGDAQQRFATHELNQKPTDTVCQHLVRPQVDHPPPPPLGTKQAGYECTAVTTRVGRTSRTDPVIVGFPFWARVNFKTGRYAWCKVTLQPSEGGIGGSLATVPLAPVCDVLDKGPA